MAINSFRTSEFPDPLKLAQVAPIHKKNSTLEKGNFGPVSILSVISKIYEKSINEFHFNSYVSALSPSYGTQSTLFKIIEVWKKALNENDLFVLFLWIFQRPLIVSHMIIYFILKFNYYGLSESALISLIKNYLSNRKQVC